MAYFILVFMQRAGPVDQNSNLSPGLIWPSVDHSLPTDRFLTNGGHSQHGDLVFPSTRECDKVDSKVIAAWRVEISRRLPKQAAKPGERG